MVDDDELEIDTDCENENDSSAVQMLEGTIKTSFSSVFLEFKAGASSRENYLCVQGSCDEGWVQYQSAYYGAVMQPKRWPKQSAFCQAYLQNAHLASIHTAEENNFIFILRGKLQDYHSGKAYWTGAHDLFKDR
ncbi:unnamed protein product, partial [Eretmochelys imbricata]